MKPHPALKPATDTMMIANAMVWWPMVMVMEVMQNVFFPWALYQHRK